METREVREVFERIVACGPRVTGTTGARAVADVVAGELHSTGLRVRREPFTVSRWPIRLAGTIVPALAAATLLVTGFGLRDRPWLAFLVLGGLLTIFVSASQWQKFDRKLFDLGRPVAGENIVARSDPWFPDRPTLLFMAHHDTKSQMLPLALRVALILASAAAALVALARTVVALVGEDTMHGPAWTVSIAAGVLCLGLVAIVGRGDRSPGALDNGSGLAVLVSLAKTLPERIAGRANAVFVSTDAEEMGLAGALRFCETHAPELDPRTTLCLNFDILPGSGRVYLSGSRSPHERVIEDLTANLRRRGFRVGRLRLRVGVGMDHMRLNAAGLWATSFTQGPWRSSWHVHSARDTAGRVDTERLAEFAGAIRDWAESLP